MTEDFNKIKRIWFITDTHFGVRNNSNEWIDLMQSYFDDWFIPLVKKNYKDGDILVHLGDVYDSRQSINLKVLNYSIDIFEKLSDIFKKGIYIMAGNHDLWGKTSNEINSLKALKWIPGVRIIEEPATFTFSGKSFFFMPWRKDHQAESECLNSAKPHDFLLCHSDIRGLKFNRYVNIEKGIDQKELKKFKRVFSGHIHYAQDNGLVRLFGSPYELTRSDMGNKKGIMLLDIEANDEMFFENKHSPRFLKIDFNRVLESTPEEANRILANDFVDITIDPRMALKAPLSIFTDTVTTPRGIFFHPHDPNQAGLIVHDIENNENNKFSVLDFIETYVSAMELDDETKSKLVKSINKLYSLATAGPEKK